MQVLLLYTFMWSLGLLERRCRSLSSGIHPRYNSAISPAELPLSTLTLASIKLKKSELTARSMPFPQLIPMGSNNFRYSINGFLHWSMSQLWTTLAPTCLRYQRQVTMLSFSFTDPLIRRQSCKNEDSNCCF